MALRILSCMFPPLLSQCPQAPHSPQAAAESPSPANPALPPQPGQLRRAPRGILLQAPLPAALQEQRQLRRRLRAQAAQGAVGAQGGGEWHQVGVSGASPCSWSPAEPEELSQELTELMYSRTWGRGDGEPPLFGGCSEGFCRLQGQGRGDQGAAPTPEAPLPSEIRAEVIAPHGTPSPVDPFQACHHGKGDELRAYPACEPLQSSQHCHTNPALLGLWIRRVLGLHQLSSAGMVQP